MVVLSFRHYLLRNHKNYKDIIAPVDSSANLLITSIAVKVINMNRKWRFDQLATVSSTTSP